MQKWGICQWTFSTFSKTDKGNRHFRGYFALNAIGFSRSNEPFLRVEYSEYALRMHKKRGKRGIKHPLFEKRYIFMNIFSKNCEKGVDKAKGACYTQHR